MTSRHRASVVCVTDNKLLVVYLQDPASQETKAYIPGGAIEPGEAPAETARREALEETGYELEIDTTSERVLDYPFYWNGERHACRTHFFRGRCRTPMTSPRPVDDASYHRGAAWLPLKEVPQAFAYHQEIWHEIAALLADSSGQPPNAKVRFTSFSDFWPFYLGEHAHPANRKLHWCGTALIILIAGFALITGRYHLLLALPLAGYSLAWAGHFFVERNRPATFTYPLWSLLADFKMFALILTGRLAAELKKHKHASKR